MRDEAGIPVPRTLMLQLERRLAAKALVYALVADQRAAPAVVAALLDLHSALQARVRGAGEGVGRGGGL